MDINKLKGHKMKWIFLGEYIKKTKYYLNLRD